MHVALTLYFYLDKEYQGYIKEHPAFYIYLPVAVILACGLFTLAFGKTGVVYLTIFYHAWLLFHYGRQNFGLMAFVCLSQGASPLGKVEKWAFQLAPIGAILGAHAVLPEFKGALGSYALLSWKTGIVIYGSALALLAYASIVSRNRDGWLPRVFFLVLALFWLPTFLFDSYQKAIMGYAVAHALQYFIFMYFSAAGNRDGARRGLLLLGMGAVVGWIILWLSREKELWGPLLYFMLGAEFGLVMWHFIVDAGLWKLRQKWQRERVRERFAFIFPAKT